MVAGILRTRRPHLPPYFSLRSIHTAPTWGRAESDAKAAALPIVRLILGITLLLLGVGTLSCRVEGTARNNSDTTAAWQWVRTVDGWERPEMWYDAPQYVPRLNPLVVALGQGLVSVLGLVACQRDESYRV